VSNSHLASLSLGTSRPTHRPIGGVLARTEHKISRSRARRDSRWLQAFVRCARLSWSTIKVEHLEAESRPTHRPFVGVLAMTEHKTSRSGAGSDSSPSPSVRKMRSIELAHDQDRAAGGRVEASTSTRVPPFLRRPSTRQSKQAPATAWNILRSGHKTSLMSWA
jgi:hypothetical protein